MCGSSTGQPFCLTEGVGVRERQPLPTHRLCFGIMQKAGRPGSDPAQKGLCLRTKVRPPFLLLQKGWGMLHGSKGSLVEKSQMDGKEHMGSSVQPFRSPFLTPL